jgi:hypothetical protein
VSKNCKDARRPRISTVAQPRSSERVEVFRHATTPDHLAEFAADVHGQFTLPNSIQHGKCSNSVTPVLVNGAAESGAVHRRLDESVLY